MHDSDLLHGLFTGDGKDQAFSKLLETILNQVLLCQSKEQLGAALPTKEQKTVRLIETALEKEK